MNVQLHGVTGTRTLAVKDVPTPTAPAPQESLSLSPATLQEVLRLMPRRWLNMSEITMQLILIHGIRVSTGAVTEAVTHCEVERRGVGTQQEVRRHDDKACELHRKACFAVVSKLRPKLQKAKISEDTLWDWVKREYNVESRTQLDVFQWVTLSAELNAAHRDNELFKVLLKRIGA